MKLVLVALFFIVIINADDLWSRVAHEITADIATAYLSKEAIQKINHYLNHTTMASHAMWADNIKRIPEWRFSSTYQYFYFYYTLVMQMFLKKTSVKHFILMKR
jgi:hypothetical protein